jgi:hypothetical protein
LAALERPGGAETALWRGRFFHVSKMGKPSRRVKIHNVRGPMPSSSAARSINKFQPEFCAARKKPSRRCPDSSMHEFVANATNNSVIHSLFFHG